jgi:hypothetical protein
MSNACASFPVELNQRIIAAGPVGYETFALATIEVYPESKSWAPEDDTPSWSLYLKNGTGANRLNFGYTPYIGRTTFNPPTPQDPWQTYGVTAIQIISAPPGWYSYSIYQNQISYINGGDLSGFLTINLQTVCGWIQVQFYIEGVY